jgi:hypothetical protein
VFDFAYKPRFGEEKRETHGFFSPSQKIKDRRRRSERVNESQLKFLA